VRLVQTREPQVVLVVEDLAAERNSRVAVEAEAGQRPGEVSGT
jgi:hypothetical protein